MGFLVRVTLNQTEWGIAMTKRILGLLLIAGFAVQAQTVNSRRKTSNEAGQAASGAVVELAARKMKDTTGSAGIGRQPIPPTASRGEPEMSKPEYVQEYAAIVEVLNKYIEGCKQAKSSIMKPAFSEHATVYSVDAEGKLSGGAVQGLFDAIDNAFRPSPEARGVVTRVEIVGRAASARIDANDISGYSFTDFFQLLKVQGKWTVISKVYQNHVVP